MMMENLTGSRIAIILLLSILILRLILKGWQKFAVARTGERFKFVLTKSPFSHDFSWRDVRYSILVIIDTVISMAILVWLMDKLF
jgi:hypothetical protein